MITKNNYMNMSFGILVLTVILTSCSSGPSENATTKEYGNVVQVDVIDHRKQEPVKDKSKAFEQIFTQKKSWFKMRDATERLREFKDKTNSQLKSELKGADEEKTTIILEVLGQRGASAVNLLATLLEDRREASFAVSRPLYWYEQKNKPAEPMEIRAYAAMQMESILKTNPSGVMFNFHKIQTSDKGTVEILYAVRGEYAVNKDDACQAWLTWWSKFKNDF